jgi:hypothetical protein
VPVHGNRPVPSNGVVERLVAALDMEITEWLESMRRLIDRLYKPARLTAGDVRYRGPRRGVAQPG